MQEPSPDAERAPASATPTSFKRPCGCVDSAAVRARAAGAKIPYAEDPCLRKVVEADLSGDEVQFPLCPDATCPHHRATSADAFRGGWAWISGYQMLTAKLRTEAVRRVRAAKLVTDAGAGRERTSGADVSAPAPVPRARPRRDADFRTRVAADRARGDSWAVIAERYGVTRQAAEKWARWEEVRAAEAVRARRRRGGIRRPERLGERDRDVEDDRAED